MTQGVTYEPGLWLIERVQLATVSVRAPTRADRAL